MRGYVLIDPPVTPYSSLNELLEWVDICRTELEKDPGNPQWEEALAEAERWLVWKHHVEPELLG